MVDYYKILEVHTAANNDEIKRSYRKLALKWHPDKNPDNLDEANKRFKEISEAYEVLSDSNKRRIYDQYGKEGLMGNNQQGRSRRHHFGGGHEFDEFDVLGGFPFMFRPPDEVFREFFGSSFSEIFHDMQNAGQSSHRSNHSGQRQRSSGSGGHRHSHPAQNNLMTSFMGLSPLVNYSMVDIMMPTDNFTAFTSFGRTSTNGRGNGKDVVKRTSTSTTFVNGKKIMTKRVFENGKETVFSYENDVLKSKTVNGVAQNLSSITN